LDKGINLSDKEKLELGDNIKKNKKAIEDLIEAHDNLGKVLEGKIDMDNYV
jgi:hypothetical protein